MRRKPSLRSETRPAPRRACSRSTAPRSTISSTSNYDGTIVGTGGSLRVTAGTTTLTNAGNSYTGPTNVSGSGTLRVNGAITGSSLVTVGSGGTLGGTGTVNLPITVNLNGTLTGTGSFGAVNLGGSLSTPAGAGNTGTINLAGLTSSGGATLNFDFAAPGTNDTAAVAGAVSLSGADTLTINPLAGFADGTYTLMTVGGTLTNTATFTINPIGALPVLTYAVQTAGSKLLLVVGATSTTWTGFAGSGWDTTSANWSPSPTGMFTNDQQVVFDDTGANTNIAVTALGVDTAGMTFNNSVNTYIIGGGPISGSGGVTLNGTGLVVLTGANTYTGNTIINGGTLQIGNAATNGAIGAGTYSLASSGARLYLDYATTVAPTWANISGSGTLELNTAVGTAGSPAADWGQASLPATFTGTLRIDTGRVYTGTTPASLGSATAVIVGSVPSSARFLTLAARSPRTSRLPEPDMAKPPSNPPCVWRTPAIRRLYRER